MAKMGIFVILVGVVIVFVFQNMQVVEVRFFAWKVSMSRALMVFVTLCMGIAAGWLVRTPAKKKNR